MIGKQVSILTERSNIRWVVEDEILHLLEASPFGQVREATLEPINEQELLTWFRIRDAIKEVCDNGKALRRR